MGQFDDVATPFRKEAVRSRIHSGVADMWILVHRRIGAITTFVTLEEAEAELACMLGNEPSWIDALWLEPFDVVVAEPLGQAD